MRDSTSQKVIELIKKQDVIAINRMIEKHAEYGFDNVVIKDEGMAWTINITHWFVLVAPENLIEPFLKKIQSQFQPTTEYQNFHQWLLKHKAGKHSLIFNALWLPENENEKVEKIFGKRSMTENLQRLEKYCDVKNQVEKQKIKVDDMAIEVALKLLRSNKAEKELVRNFLDWESQSVEDENTKRAVVVYFFVCHFETILENFGKNIKTLIPEKPIFSCLKKSDFNGSSLKDFWFKINDYFNKDGSKLISFLSDIIKKSNSEDDELLIAIHYQFGRGIKDDSKKAALCYLRAYSLSYNGETNGETSDPRTMIKRMSLHGLKLLQVKNPQDAYFKALVIQCEVLENPSFDLPQFFSISPEISYSTALLELADRAIKAKKFGDAALWYCSAMVSEFHAQIRLCGDHLKNCMSNLDIVNDRAVLFRIHQQITIAMSKTATDKITVEKIRNTDYVEMRKEIFSKFKEFLPYKFSLLIEQKNKNPFFGKDAIFKQLQELVAQSTYAGQKYCPALLELAKWTEEGFGVEVDMLKAVDLYGEAFIFPSNESLSPEENLLYQDTKESAKKALERIARKWPTGQIMVQKIQGYLNPFQASAPPETVPQTRRGSKDLTAIANLLLNPILSQPMQPNASISSINTNNSNSQLQSEPYQEVPNLSLDKNEILEKNPKNIQNKPSAVPENQLTISESPKKAVSDNITVTEGVKNFTDTLQELQKWQEFLIKANEKPLAAEQEITILKAELRKEKQKNATLEEELKKEKQENSVLKTELKKIDEEKKMAAVRNWVPGKWKPALKQPPTSDQSKITNDSPKRDKNAAVEEKQTSKHTRAASLS